MKSSRRCYKNDSSTRNTIRVPLPSVSIWFCRKLQLIARVYESCSLNDFFVLHRDTDSRFSSDTDFSEDPDGRSTNTAKGKVRKTCVLYFFKPSVVSVLGVTCRWSHCINLTVPGWEEGEKGCRRKRQRSKRSRPNKWPPPGKWHGKHDVVWGGEVGQECHAGKCIQLLSHCRTEHIS